MSTIFQPDEVEERIRRAIAAGSRLDEARKKCRYFQLQSRVER